MTEINTFEGGRVFASASSPYSPWISVNEVNDPAGGVITVVITHNRTEATLTVPEAEALVRHLRRAIRRQKARIAQ